MKKLLLVLMLAGATLTRAQSPAPDSDRRPPQWDDMDLTQPPPPPDGTNAAPPPGEQDLQPQAGQRPDQGGAGEPGFAVQRLLEVIHEKNPSEYDRLTKLRTEDPQAFREELRTLLRSEWERRGMRGEGSDGEGWQGKQPDERDRMGHHGMEGGPGHALDGANIRSPEIDKLEQQSHELARAYHDAKDDTEKSKLRDQLHATLAQAYDLRENVRRERLEQMENRLHRLRDMFDQRQTHRDEIIDRRLKELTEVDTLAW